MRIWGLSYITEEEAEIMADLEIIGGPNSNYVRSIRMLCEEKGVAYKLTPARPHSPDVNAIHPAGLIPCLRHGGVALFESAALAVYIDNAFAGPKFLPTDAVGAALCMQWTSYGNAKVDHWIMRQFVVPTAFADKEKGPDMAKINAAVPEIEKIVAVLDKALAATGYLCGASLTYADMNVIPMLDYGMKFPATKAIIGRHASLSAYHAKLTVRESFAKITAPPRD